jgi:hypothetical protein
MKSVSATVCCAALAAAALFTVPARAEPGVAPPAAIAALARTIAAELMMRCPVADADDAEAFESCRAALDDGGSLRAALPEVMLWGRQDQGARTALAGARFTQLAPDLWAHLYAPLFMFNGNHQVEWIPGENQFVIRLEAAFRNRLAPGQFPSPFWHDAGEWSSYQHANAMLLWVQPQSGRIHVAQFTDQAATPLLQPVTPVARRFDGQWMWTDAGGRSQPAVALLDAQARPGNPFRLALDRQYRDLALQMREAQCSSCHVPSNPQGSRRLVLLSTPAHTAGEIDRVIRLVRDTHGQPGAAHALSREDRQWLLQSAEAFRDTVRAARDWEQQAARQERGLVDPIAQDAVSLTPTLSLRR